jgi:hypothetical protein
MPESNTPIVDFLDKVPPPDEVRRQIAVNLRQGKLLRQVLRMAEQRESVREVSRHGRPGVEVKK